MAAKVPDLAKLYFLSSYGAFKNRDLFEDVRTYCMFIGLPRSGHSLIGALLDAHPNMVIAHELDALKYIRMGFSERQIYYLLLGKSQSFVQAGSLWLDDSYKVPNQWQGRVDKKLQVIGDKKGGGSAITLSSNLELLQRLHKTINHEIKFILVIRNPYDTISSILKLSPNANLNKCITVYFSLCESVANVKRQIERGNLLEIRHESFIENPRTCLKKLCHFLGTEVSNDYLTDCASIVFKSPRKRRHQTPWNRQSIDLVRNEIDKFNFLHGYSYED